MAFSTVGISRAFHPSLEAVGGGRSSGFLGVQPSCMVAVKVKDQVSLERVMVNLRQCQRSPGGCQC